SCTLPTCDAALDIIAPRGRRQGGSVEQEHINFVVVPFNRLRGGSSERLKARRRYPWFRARGVDQGPAYDHRRGQPAGHGFEPARGGGGGPDHGLFEPPGRTHGPGGDRTETRAAGPPGLALAPSTA